MEKMLVLFSFNLAQLNRVYRFVVVFDVTFGEWRFLQLFVLIWYIVCVTAPSFWVFDHFLSSLFFIFPRLFSILRKFFIFRKFYNLSRFIVCIYLICPLIAYLVIRFVDFVWFSLFVDFVCFHFYVENTALSRSVQRNTRLREHIIEIRIWPFMMVEVDAVDLVKLCDNFSGFIENVHISVWLWLFTNLLSFFFFVWICFFHFKL